MRRVTVGALILVACGGSGARVQAPHDEEPRLLPGVAEQRWYRSPSMCGQGPYELELPVSGMRWGEEFELRVHAPHAVELKAIVLADDEEVARGGGVYTAQGATQQPPENSRCVADARERLTLGRPGGGGGGGGTPGTPGVTVVTPPDAPPPSTTPAPLELDATLVTTSHVIVDFGWRDGDPRLGAPPKKIRIRFWSITPNDLEGVLFGVARIEWRPNVGDAAYEAHLAAIARREEEARRAPPPPPTPSRPQPVRVVTDAELRARAEAEARTRARAEEERRARAIAAALAEERRARRKEFCATHPEDRDCWGAGGMKVALELDARAQERARYCAANPEDARCWDATERARRQRLWDQRRTLALAPPPAPDGPPPAALAEVVPPKLSVNAEWRPGYWHWAGDWFWIGGMWRVPDRDIEAEQTTVAPAAPPALQVETPPPPPVVAAVWVPGFWQWNGAAWVWIAGSWQLRPEARATWRVPEWRVRGDVHVLIPGGWITGRPR